MQHHFERQPLLSVIEDCGEYWPLFFESYSLMGRIGVNLLFEGSECALTGDDVVKRLQFLVSRRDGVVSLAVLATV